MRADFNSRPANPARLRIGKRIPAHMAESYAETEQKISAVLVDHVTGNAVPADVLADALKDALNLIGQLREDVYQAEYGR